MTTLDRSDIETLLEALPAWESKDTSGEMVGSLMESLMLGGREVPPDVKAKMKADREAREREAKQTRQQRHEISIQLQAKLLSMRNAIVMPAGSETA